MCTGAVKKTAVFTSIPPRAQTSDIKKHKPHNVLILLFISFYIYLFNAFTYQFCLGEEHGHKIKTAGETGNANDPFGPRAESS